MSNQLGLAILFTTCLIPSIFSGILLPDLGNLSDKDMEDLVYSLLANSGNNNLDMDTRSWNPSTYPSFVESMYKRTPAMQLDHSNPTTRLFANNPYHKRSANMFSGLQSQLGNQKFIDGLYKRSNFWDRLKRDEAEKREEADKREAEKRSANMFSGMQSRLGNQRFINDLYKRSANMFSGMQSGLRNGEFINGLYKREAEKRSANMFSGMQSGLQNNDFINGLYKRGDNYAYSPVTDLNASDYWKNLINAYSRQNARYMYKRETKETSESDDKQIKPEAEKKEKKSDDSASPASL